MYPHGMPDVWDLKVSTYWVVDWDWMTWSSTWNYSMQMVKRCPHNRWISPPPPPVSYWCISNSMFCAVLDDIKMLDQFILELTHTHPHTHTHIYIYWKAFSKASAFKLIFHTLNDLIFNILIYQIIKTSCHNSENDIFRLIGGIEDQWICRYNVDSLTSRTLFIIG